MVPEQKFWRSPDLVAQLLSFIDVSSTLALAKVLPLSLHLLQRKFIWRDLICRSRINEDYIGDLTLKEEEEDFYEIKAEVEQMVAILMMMESPEDLLQDLLDTICERTPFPFNEEVKITISCNRHLVDHVVQAEGFELLEVAEGLMGTALQQIKEINYDIDYIDDDWFEGYKLAVKARLQRQVDQLQFVSMFSISISSNDGFSATILQNTKWDIEQYVLIADDFGEEGWSWFAKSKEQNKDTANLLYLDDGIILKAKKEDLKAVWEATDPEFGEWQLVKGPVFSGEGRLDRGLEEILCRSWREEEEEGGKMVDLGWRRIEELWDAGQKI